MSEKFSLKDELFNEAKVRMIGEQIKKVYSEFENEVFTKEVVSKFASLELKERIFHIRDMLKQHVPFGYEKSIEIFLSALPKELDATKEDDDFGDFIYAPYGEYIATYGCTKEYVQTSLDALCEITKRFSMEFAIRDFINKFPKQSFSTLQKCSLSKNYHQRRFSSEALRLKLPWAKKIDIDYKSSSIILDNLYADKTRYVTRSVANHLNDISKIDPMFVLETLKKWALQKKQNDKELEYITNHALRTLIKNAHTKSLEFLGFHQNPKIEVTGFSLNFKEIKIGEKLEFCFDIKAFEDEALLVDYIMYFKTKNQKLSKKVHKLKKLSLKKEEEVKVAKSHLFKSNMTTRKLYEGTHKIEIQINGKIYANEEFYLSKK